MTKDTDPKPDEHLSPDPLTDPHPETEKPGEEWIPEPEPADGDGPLP
ncbi:hypothetical protein [Frondihabitans australicus]|uniref:Uncharacterized protein n=1 Tax=Frondihabitans australicus TaxID=386892 RepID=A0A495IDE7_9MICO|nr:hypothetical protein [Frondihabitans australicus]RKR73879.1 hypothetical protein C8E83_0976 [Frondihabitans australicus]